MGLKVEKAGLLTTVQDLGRTGYQKEGVVVSGPMDALAHRVANLLVGNQENAATLEFTMLGPSLRFEADHLISLAGASFAAQINGIPVAFWKPIWVRKGALLEIGSALKGLRGYLAVAGGIQVPLVLGSASTYLRAGLGGLHGLPLQNGSLVPCAGATSLPSHFQGKETTGRAFVPANWFPAPELLPRYQENPLIRVLRGPEWEWFSPESQQTFWEQPYRVTPQSDRMGYRLAGPFLKLAPERELLSTGVTFGTVQVPARGNPIVLLADHQTTGGYPRIAQVITADFSLLAQVAPGQSLRFTEVTLEEAYQHYFRQELNLEKLKSAVSLKLNL